MSARVVITALLSIILCAGLRAMPTQILFKSYPEQLKVIDSILEKEGSYNSTVALTHIYELKAWAERKGDLQLEYGFRLLKYKFMRHRYKITNNDLDSLLTLIKDLERNKMQPLKAEALHLLGDYYWDNKDYSAGLENFILAYNIYKNYSADEFPHKAESMFRFGGAYYFFRDFATAKKYMLEVFQTIPLTNLGAIASKYNTIALCYDNLQMSDSALYYFNKAKEKAIADGEDVWIGILSGNVGKTLYLQKKYDEAIPMLEKNIELSSKYGMSDDVAFAMATLGDIYLHKNDFKKGFDLELMAYDTIVKYSLYKDYNIRKAVYPLLAKGYEKNGQPAKAYAFLDSTIMANDSLARLKNIMVLSGAQHKVEVEQHLNELNKTDRDRKFALLLRDGLIVFFCLTGLIAFLFINRLRMNYNRRQQQLETENVKAQKDLEIAGLQLADFTKNLAEKNKLVERISMQLQSSIAGGGGSAYDSDAFVQLQRSTILTDDQWMKFQKMFEKVHKGFVKRLKEKYSDLSPIEMKFVLLTKLRFSDREIGSVLGISDEAVNLNLKRLCSRFYLEPNGSVLEKYVDEI